MGETLFFSCFLDQLTVHRNLLLPLGVSSNTTTTVTRGAALAADGFWCFGHRNRYRCWSARRERDSHGDRSGCWRWRRSSRNWIRLFHNIVHPLFLKRSRETQFDNKTWTRHQTNSGFCRKCWDASHQLILFITRRQLTCQIKFQNLPKLDFASIFGINFLPFQTQNSQQ